MRKSKIVTICRLCGAALPHTPQALKIHRQQLKENTDAFWKQQKEYWRHVLESSKAP